MDITFGEIWGTVITGIIAALVKAIFSMFKEQKEKHEREEQMKTQILSQLMETNKELVTWKNHIDEKNENIEIELRNLGAQIDYISTANLLLMKDKIIHTCKYYINKGEIPLSVRDNLIEMYQCYQNMGGNGTGKIMFEQAMNLQVTNVVMLESHQEGVDYHENDGTQSPPKRRTTRRKKDVEPEN